MKKVLRQRFKMAVTVEVYLRKNRGMFSGNAPLEATVDLLGAKIIQMRELMTERSSNDISEVFTKAKNQSRKALEEEAFLLSTVCCGYAAVVGDKDYFEQCSYSRSAFKHFKDRELIGVCRVLLDEFKSRVTELLPYNISEARIEAFETAIDSFTKKVGKPREQISKRADATAKAESLLKEIMEMIRLRLDKIVIALGASKPEFVFLYKSARMIKDLPTRRRSLTVIVQDAETQKPISQAVVKTAKGILKKSGKMGMNFIQKLAEGSYELLVSHPGYESQTLRYAVQSGNSTKLKVMMRKVEV